MLSLPLAVQTLIFERLDVYALKAVASTCRQFRQTLTDLAPQWYTPVDPWPAQPETGSACYGWLRHNFRGDFLVSSARWESKKTRNQVRSLAGEEAPQGTASWRVSTPLGELGGDEADAMDGSAKLRRHPRDSLDPDTYHLLDGCDQLVCQFTTPSPICRVQISNGILAYVLDVWGAPNILRVCRVNGNLDRLHEEEADRSAFMGRCRSSLGVCMYSYANTHTHYRHARLRPDGSLQWHEWELPSLIIQTEVFVVGEVQEGLLVTLSDENSWLYYVVSQHSVQPQLVMDSALKVPPCIQPCGTGYHFLPGVPHPFIAGCFVSLGRGWLRLHFQNGRVLRGRIKCDGSKAFDACEWLRHGRGVLLYHHNTQWSQGDPARVQVTFM